MAKKSFGKIIGIRKSLRWRIVTVLLAAAMLPLALAGFGSWIVFGQLLEKESLGQMRTIVESHANAIDAHLSERLHLLRLAAESHSIDEMIQPGRLQKLLDDLNRSSNRGFIDLGVINAEGNHLAYTGPYDLQNKNYSQSDWFREVNIRGEYISDVFLGFRQVPHCIIAVKATDNNLTWILRATISSDQFDALVKAGALGEGGDAYIVNRSGQYQTTPQYGALLDTVPQPMAGFHPGLRDRRIKIGETTKIQATTWINDNRWMLVVERDLAAVQAPVDQAIVKGANVVLVAVMFLALITFIATRHLTRQIDKATAEREEMSRAFVRSAKLASIGELTTGLAHEINNPLAIISAEQTNISDLLRELGGDSEAKEQLLLSVVRCQAQVQRCAGITRKLLQFGRSQESRVVPTEIAPRLTEIADLMRRHAGVRNVGIETEIEKDLPQVMVDPLELEQVLVNLINNSLDAMPEGGKIAIKTFRDGNRALLEVTDTGSGIAPDIIDRIFEPFFTTKPVGKGTGLGLSVCYGIVNSWGGSMEAKSAPGLGTTMKIILPLREGGRINNQ